MINILINTEFTDMLNKTKAIDPEADLRDAFKV